MFEDNGIGVEEQYLPRIFDMFFRASEQSEGFGLGMYIGKQTVEKLGGSIAIESTFGKGTTVSVRIPNQGNPIVLAKEFLQPERLMLNSMSREASV
jgi:signal transduction histidine kinase